jgi:WD40 repeat protein
VGPRPARRGDGSLRLESTRVFHLPGYGSSASFSPDGRRLALAYDSGARVVDVESGATLYELPDHDHRSIIDIAFDPSGSVLATAAFDNTVRIFEGAGPRQLVLCRGVPTRPRGIVWAPDGRWLASWQTTRDAKVWYGRTRPFLTVLQPHAGALATARYDPSGQRVVAACADGHAAVFDARSGELVQRIEPASTSAAIAADYDATGARVVVTSADGTVSVLRSADGALESSYAGLAGGPVASFLPDGARLAYLASSGEPVLVTLATGALVHLKGAHGHVISLCASGDGARVACGTDERTVHLWKLDGGGAELEQAWTFGPYEEANHKLNSVYNVALSADGRRLAATTQHLRTYLLDADDGRQLSDDISATVGNVAFTRDGHYLFATGKWTGFVRAYKLGGQEALPFEVFQLRDVAAWSRALDLPLPGRRAAREPGRRGRARSNRQALGPRQRRVPGDLPRPRRRRLGRRLRTRRRELRHGLG